METAYRPAPPPSLRATGSLCRLGPWCWTCASCPASSGDKAVGALNIEQWLHMHEDVLTRNVMVTALSYLLVSCYVKVMLSACLSATIPYPLARQPAAHPRRRLERHWLPPAAYALIEKSCSARPNGWPQPQFLLSIEYFLRLLLLRSMPAFFLFA